MKVAVYSCQAYEQPFIEAANSLARLELSFFRDRLTLRNVQFSRDCAAVTIYSRDDASAPVLRALQSGGTRLLALRSAGFNHVDLPEAERLGLTVLRVPAYSPHAIAEHAVGLMLTLNRKFHRAFNRVREQNFRLEGLMGFDMVNKTVGVVGTGKIGECVCRILRGFGCQVVATDPVVNPNCVSMEVRYVELPQLLELSDIITLHCPLTPSTYHLMDATALEAMKPTAMLINTSRGAVVDTQALIATLKQGRLRGVGLDVYEEEGDLFFQDLSNQVIQDDVFMRLLTFPNVLITGHQGFFTEEALTAIAKTTIQNIHDFETGNIREEHRVTARLVVPSNRMTTPAGA